MILEALHDSLRELSDYLDFKIQPFDDAFDRVLSLKFIHRSSINPKALQTKNTKPNCTMILNPIALIYL